jgi:hypothetical protein
MYHLTILWLLRLFTVRERRIFSLKDIGVVTSVVMSLCIANRQQPGSFIKPVIFLTRHYNMSEVLTFSIY